MLTEEKYSLLINRLSIEEITEVCEKLREIEQRHPEETIMIWIHGLENKSAKEAIEFINKVFPKKKEEP